MGRALLLLSPPPLMSLAPAALAADAAIFVGAKSKSPKYPKGPRRLMAVFLRRCRFVWWCAFDQSWVLGAVAVCPSRTRWTPRLSCTSFNNYTSWAMARLGWYDLMMDDGMMGRRRHLRAPKHPALSLIRFHRSNHDSIPAPFRHHTQGSSNLKSALAFRSSVTRQPPPPIHPTAATVAYGLVPHLNPSPT